MLLPARAQNDEVGLGSRQCLEISGSQGFERRHRPWAGCQLGKHDQTMAKALCVDLDPVFLVTRDSLILLGLSGMQLHSAMILSRSGRQRAGAIGHLARFGAKCLFFRGATLRGAARSNLSESRL